MYKKEPTKRILVVDDHEDVLRCLSSMLADECEVESVRSAREALERLREKPFDAIVTDYELMGQCNGHMLLEFVRRDWPAVRRILISGYAMTVRDSGDSAVVHRYLRKPFTLRDLFSSLDMTL